MGAIVMLPELGVAVAMGQYLEATEFARRVKGGKGGKGSKVKENKAKGNKVKGNKVKGDELTRTHAFYANMGGFIMKLQAPSHPKLPLTSASKHVIRAEDHLGDTEQHTTSTATPISPDVVNEETPLFRVRDWKDLG